MDSRASRRGRIGALALLALLWVGGAWPGEARGQGSDAPPSIDADRFSPHGDHTGWFATLSPEALGLWRPAAGIWGSYARSPVVIYSPSGNIDVVRDMWALHVQGALGFGIGDLAVSLPIHPQVAGDGYSTWGEPPAGAALGDLEIVPKVRFVDPAVRGFGVGLAAPISVPTGDDQLYVGNGKATIAPMLVMAAYVGPVRIGGNLGYRFAPQIQVLDVHIGRGFTYRAAVSVHPHSTIGVVGEVFGDHAVGDRNSPGEWQAGVRVRPIPEVAISVAGGSSMGLAVASPRWRLTFGVSVSPQIRRDRDGDGVVDRRDECPDEPEDVDGDRDSDGCVDHGRRVQLSLSQEGWVDLPHPHCARLPVAEGSFELDLGPEVAYLSVGAEGYETQRVELSGDGPVELPPVVLQPTPNEGALVVHALGAEGLLEGARLRVGDTRRVMAGGWGELELAPGEYTVEVDAAGLLAETVDATVVAGRVTFARVALETTDAADVVTGEAASEVPSGAGDEATTDPADLTVAGEIEALALGLRIFFDTGSSEIKPEFEAPLAQLAEIMARWGGAGVIEVIGMADPPGSPATNAVLSRARAQAAYDRLIALGVPADRLRVEVVNPYATGAVAGAEDRVKRRVEFRLVEE